MNNIVYGLFDPLTKELRYIGKSTQGIKRARSHKYYLGREDTHKARWLRKLLSLGFDYEIEVIEVFDSSEYLEEAEQFYISYFTYIGCNLTNHTKGGEGRPGCRHTPESKAKLSTAHKGKRLSSEHKFKLSQAHAGKSLSEKHKEALRKASPRIRTPRSEETRQKISNSLGGKKIVDQHGNLYLSQRDAARTLGVNQSAVARVVSGERKSIHGLELRYINNGNT